jgi:hypothetical protein
MLKPFRAKHEILRLKALVLVVWIYLVSKNISERKVSRYFSAVEAALQQYNLAYTLPWKHRV